jgi:hypothetical protein
MLVGVEVGDHVDPSTVSGVPPNSRQAVTPALATRLRILICPLPGM